MKYKVGDKVRVKPRKWFEKLEIVDGDRVTPGGEYLMDYHADAAGDESVISKTRDDNGSALYFLRGHSYSFPEEILGLVVEK